jgi:DNA-binding transcriptional LysR family regulator
MRMTALEQRLGVPLLRRAPSGTRVTPEGERVVSQARRVLAEVHALMSEVEAVRAEGSRRLRVAASLTVAEHLLPAWISAVHRASPELSLTLEVLNSARVVTAVADGWVDIGFVENDERDPPGLDSVAVSADHLVVVVPADHRWARAGRAVTGAELAGAELVVRETGSGTRDVLENALAPWGGVRTRLELGTPSAIIDATRRGEGPGVVSVFAVTEEVATGRLVEVELEGVSLARVLRAVWTRERPLPELARRLLQAAQADGPAGR